MFHALEVVALYHLPEALASRAVFYGKLKPEYYGTLGPEFNFITVSIYDVSWERPYLTFENDLRAYGYRLHEDGFIDCSGNSRPYDTRFPQPNAAETLHNFNVYPAVETNIKIARQLNQCPRFSKLIKFRDGYRGPVRLSDVLTIARTSGIRRLHCFLNYTATLQQMGLRS